MVCPPSPPPFLYILINMSPFWYDRYLYWRPDWGGFTWRGRVKGYIRDTVHKQTGAEWASQAVSARAPWAYMSLVMLSSESHPDTELQWDADTPSWALRGLSLSDAAVIKLAPSLTLPTSLITKEKHKLRSGGAVMVSQNAHQNPSRTMRASY